MSTHSEVLIEGDGIAAVCCARLLTDARIPCCLAKTERPKLAAVLLGEQTQALLRDLFPGGPADPDLFAGFPTMSHRIVRWGAAREAVAMPHRGVVVSEAELLTRLWQRVPPLPTAAMRPDPAWSIVSSRGSLLGASNLHFGTRSASLCNVLLTAGAATEACWAESTPSGWLFLLSTGGGHAVLIGVGADLTRLLAASTLIAPAVSVQLDAAQTAPAYPRLLHPLANAGQLACGSAAMAFDPLCGEGTGNAVREAFLAAAVVRAALSGGSAEALLSHYAARLRLGFLRHLEICRQFYSTGGPGSFWTAECAALDAGILRLQSMLAGQSPPLFRMVDRDLIPISG